MLGAVNRELERLQTIITGKESAGTSSRYDVMRINQEVHNLKARLKTIAVDSGLKRARRERWPVPSLLLGTTSTNQPYGNATYAGSPWICRYLIAMCLPSCRI